MTDILHFELYGGLDRLVGQPRLQLAGLQAQTTLGEALQQLAQQYPALAERLERCACAVGDRLVPRQQRLNEIFDPAAATHHHTVALLPPVVGG